MQDNQGVTPSGPGYSPYGSSQSSLSQAEPSIPNADARLAELLALEEGWNGYRGKPVDRAVAERVRAFYPLAERLGLDPWICPMSDGGLLVERGGVDDWSIEFAPDGTVAVYFDYLSDKDALGLVAMFAQMKALDAAAQGFEARQRDDREAGHGRNDESPVANGDAPND